jgi:hypothetical protein
MINHSDRGLLIDPEKLFYRNQKLHYASNPAAISINDSQLRIFFNSRDFQNRSAIYSIDFFHEELEPDYESVRIQHLHGPKDSYFSHGLSIGQIFSLDTKKCLSVMGWKNYVDKHWEGRIGYIPIDVEGNLTQLALKPWMDLDKEDPISLSYPAVYEDAHARMIWYGSTLSWDAGNGEMLHVLKEARLSLDGQIIKGDIKLPHVLGSAQAFSRPAIVQTGEHFLLAYSYRGNTTKYRIGFTLLDDLNSASHLGGIPPFLTSEDGWDSEMVEYPSFFFFREQLFMLYNGNSFGRSGIGIVKIQFDETIAMSK